MRISEGSANARRKRAGLGKERLHDSLKIAGLRNSVLLSSLLSCRGRMVLGTHERVMTNVCLSIIDIRICIIDKWRWTALTLPKYSRP